MLNDASRLVETVLVRRFPEELRCVGLDGFLRVRPRVVDSETLAWTGFCYLLPEGIAPVAVRLSLDTGRKRIRRIWCGLGERTEAAGTLVPIAYEPGHVDRAVKEVAGRLEQISWAFEAEAGRAGS